jgi:hypothetical protein
MSPVKHIGVVLLAAALAYGVTYITTNGLRDQGEDSTFGIRLKIPTQVGRYFAGPNQKVNPIAFNVAVVGECLVDGVMLDVVVLGFLAFRRRNVGLKV